MQQAFCVICLLVVFCVTPEEQHCSRNIRDSAAQSRLRSSAQGLLCLLCAGACRDRDVSCAGKPKNDVKVP